ncbi:MAG: DUF6508 domain-containing protein [Nitriliruptoraceae bacterium]
MSIDPPQPPAEELDWGPALSWLPVLATDGFEPGRFAGGEETEPGVFTMPYAVLAPEAAAFVGCLYETDVVTGTDWTTWLEEGGVALYEDPERLATATLEECRILLIAHVRNDRFVEGHLLSILRDGHLVAVLERIRELVGPTD